MAAPDSPTQYEYQSLEHPNSIRLLIVHPGSHDDPIICELQHHDLETNPEFEAVSYVWGKPVYTSFIVCDGRSLICTPTLHRALLRIRLSDQPRTIWADGVCINQLDIKERGHQVTLMQQVYRDANQVLIWLGPNNDKYAQEAFSICTSISEARQDVDLIEEDISELDLDVGGLDWHESLYKLAECEWFRRVWVVQELVLAKAPVLLWGDQQITWGCIHQTVETLRNIKMDGKPLPMNHISLGLNPIARLCAIKTRIERPRPFSRVLSTMHDTRTMRCSDDHDRVYGLLGISYQGIESDAVLASHIAPDYTKPVETLYWEFASLAIGCGYTQDIFLGIQHVAELDEWQEGSLPSWVPRWNLFDSWYFRQYYDFGQLEFTDNSIIADAKPGTNSAQDPITKLSKGICCIRSANLDEIISVSQPLYDETHGLALQHIVDFWSEAIQPIDLEDFTHRSLNLHFCEALTHRIPTDNILGLFTTYTRTLLGYSRQESPTDQHSGLQFRDTITHQTTTDKISALFNSHVQTLLGHSNLTKDASFDVPSHPAHRMLASMERSLLKMEEMAIIGEDHVRWQPIYQQSIPETVRGRRLFKTKGNLIGIGFAALRVGDSVKLLHKAGCPMILRKQNDFWRVIGGSYISGMMDATRSELQAKIQRVGVKVIELR